MTGGPSGHRLSVAGWRAGVLALVLTASAVSMIGLGRAPLLLGGDEAYFAVNGHALASTGADLSGRHLPLFVNLRDPLSTEASSRWYQPMLFYLKPRCSWCDRCRHSPRACPWRPQVC